MNLSMNSTLPNQQNSVKEDAPANRKRGFLEWMEYIQNVHQGNYSAIDRALERLNNYDNEK